MQFAVTERQLLLQDCCAGQSKLYNVGAFWFSPLDGLIHPPGVR